jgi:hypothetical protein
MIPKSLLEEINRWITEKRYGNLQINFCNGKIVNVNRVESIKIDMLMGDNQDIKVTATITNCTSTEAHM